MQFLRSGNPSRIVSTVCLLLSWMLATVTAGEIRQWTYTPPGSGREAKFEAEFVGVNGVIVMLKGKDGKDYVPPLASLGEEDVRYVEKMSRTDRGEFIDWTDALGNELKVRYAGIAGQAVMLVTQEGGALQVPWEGLDAKQRAFVIKAQQAAVAAKAQAGEAARQWVKEDGIEMVTSNADEMPDDDRAITFLTFSADNRQLLSVSETQAAVWDALGCRKRCQLQSVNEVIGYVVGERMFAKRHSFNPTGTEVWWFEG